MATATIPPTTYRAFRRTTGAYPLTLTPSTEPPLPPTLGPHDVLARIRAVALNFRDVGMLHEGRYPVAVLPGGIPASDCAAEVVAVGGSVTRFAVGDRVAPTFYLAEEGRDERDGRVAALGGDVEGVLREWAVWGEGALVGLPAGLGWVEAATITCAGVTAWTALNSLDVRGGSVALLQGTGGVSMFALQLCIAAGIKPIITSSSDAKLEAIKKLSPMVEGINYKTHADVAAEVLRLTDGKGVDIVVNNTGAASFPSDLASLRKRHGTISWVGFLEGFKADWDPSQLLSLLTKTAKIQGIAVGTKKDFEDLCKFMEDKKVQLTSIIDRVFTFDEAPEAFEYLYSGKHVGKVVIKL